jgi:hypothetical protein
MDTRCPLEPAKGAGSTSPRPGEALPAEPRGLGATCGAEPNIVAGVRGDARSS